MSQYNEPNHERCGIYAIVCDPLDCWYVGSSRDIDHRWETHRRLLSAGKHKNKRLAAAWATHGEESFRLELLEVVQRERLREREQDYLTILFQHPVRHRFNISRGDGIRRMSGHTSWNEIKTRSKNAGDPAHAAKIAAKVQSIENAQRLYDLRKSLGKTQIEVARQMGAPQKRISEIEHASNLEYKTIADYVRALGADLEVRAVFADREPVVFRLAK